MDSQDAKGKREWLKGAARSLIGRKDKADGSKTGERAASNVPMRGLSSSLTMFSSGKVSPVAAPNMKSTAAGPRVKPAASRLNDFDTESVNTAYDTKSTEAFASTATTRTLGPADSTAKMHGQQLKTASTGSTNRETRGKNLWKDALQRLPDEDRAFVLDHTSDSELGTLENLRMIAV